jgi:hypothetical protein
MVLAEAAVFAAVNFLMYSGRYADAAQCERHLWAIWQCQELLSNPQVITPGSDDGPTSTGGTSFALGHERAHVQRGRCVTLDSHVVGTAVSGCTRSDCIAARSNLDNAILSCWFQVGLQSSLAGLGACNQNRT